MIMTKNIRREKGSSTHQSGRAGGVGGLFPREGQQGFHFVPGEIAGV